MSNDELKEYIRTMLGESYVDVELTDEDIHIIVKQALSKVAPYYDGRRFILGKGPPPIFFFFFLCENIGFFPNFI